MFRLAYMWTECDHLEKQTNKPIISISQHIDNLHGGFTTDLGKGIEEWYRASCVIAKIRETSPKEYDGVYILYSEGEED